MTSRRRLVTPRPSPALSPPESLQRTAFRLRIELRRARHSQRRDSLRLAALLNDYGVLCKEHGRLREAEHSYRRALRLVGRPARHPELTATLHHNLAGALHSRGRFSQALPIARRGLALRQAIRPRNGAALAADQAALAAILVELRRFREARALYRGALRRFRRALGARHCELGATLAARGALEARAGRWRAAERLLRRGIAGIERALGTEHPRLVAPLNNLAVVCARHGKTAEAVGCYRRALRALPAGRAPRHPPEVAVRANLRKLALARKSGRVRSSQTSAG